MNKLMYQLILLTLRIKTLLKERRREKKAEALTLNLRYFQCMGWPVRAFLHWREIRLI